MSSYTYLHIDGSYFSSEFYFPKTKEKTKIDKAPEEPKKRKKSEHKMNLEDADHSSTTAGLCDAFVAFN